MADFVYSKGYLVSAPSSGDAAFGWGDKINLYLQGSESVNDTVSFIGTDGHHYAAYATNNDIVVVKIADSGDLTAIVNTLAGWATGTGGFSSVAYVDDYLYLVPRAAPNTIWRVQVSTLSGDSTPGGWAAWFTGGGSTTFPSLTALDIGGTGYLGIAVGDNSDDSMKVAVMDVPTQTFYLQREDDGGDVAFPKDAPNASPHLYWYRGQRVYCKYNIDAIAVSDWEPDVSYGRIDDAFDDDDLDGAAWRESETGNMTADATFDETGGVLAFDADSSAPGAGEARLTSIAYIPGLHTVRVAVDISAIPSAGVGEDRFVALDLVSPDGLTRYRVRAGNRDSGTFGGTQDYYLHGEVTEGGVVVDEQYLYFTDVAAMDIAGLWVGRYSSGGGGGRTATMGKTKASDGLTSSVLSSTAAADVDTALSPRVVVGDNSGSGTGTWTGSFSDFLLFIGPDANMDTPQQDIAAVGLSGALTGDGRQILCGFADDSALILYTDETDEGGGTSEATATVGAAVTDAVCSPITCATMDTTGIRALIGGTGGVTQYQPIDGGGNVYSLSSVRDYTGAYDHAQPLVDTDVTCLSWANIGFSYGTYSDYVGAGSGGADDAYYGTGALGADGGGAGFIQPDFTAPLGSGAWAEARHVSGMRRIRSGALHPNPVPSDYLHAHIERRLNGGSWQRLKENGWTAYIGGGWDHDSDIAFVDDPLLGSMGTVIQEDDALAPGRWEYRFVYHDEAGNAGELAAATAYGDGAEYLDAPAIASVIANDGDAATSDAGVTLALAANSGAASGAVTHRVFEVRLWDDAMLEADAVWRRYREGARYPHVLSGGAGLRTIFARARHVSEDEGAPASATIQYQPIDAEPAAAAGPERVMICFGREPIEGVNFSSDAPGVISATSEDADFPAANAAQGDLSTPWKSDGVGLAILEGGGVTFQTELRFAFPLGVNIEAAALAGHNLPMMADLAARAGGSMRVYLEGAADAGFTTSVFSVDLTAIARAKIVAHRPGTSRPHWRFRFRLEDVDPNTIEYLLSHKIREPWTIGRAILNESALCYRPPYNHDERARVTHHDPSTIVQTLGQARRVVVREPYRVVEMRFSDVPAAQVPAFETVWRRQRAARPVLVLLEPERVAAGLAAPAEEDADAISRSVVYGYLDESMSVAASGFAHHDVTLVVQEANG
ncbi:hypothetical protein K8I61_13950 [bacterium]|nr:hypothetical protein [bacterium]